MWMRRLASKCNGVSYIVQRGAEAIFSKEGLTEIKENINYYKENASIIANTLNELNIFFTKTEINA